MEPSFGAWPRPDRSGSVRFRQFWLILTFDPSRCVHSWRARVGKYWRATWALLDDDCGASSVAAVPETSRRCSGVSRSYVLAAPAEPPRLTATSRPPTSAMSATTDETRALTRPPLDVGID